MRFGRGEGMIFDGPAMPAVRACHLVTGGTLVPRCGWEALLGASAQFSSEGTHLKTGSIERDEQMPLA